ncbi:MAG: peptide deformylase [Tissierellia bacterium]|nr:peptide deformylase [Tissierellia bacterium]
MALLEIRKDEEAILRKTSKEVKVFDERLKTLAEDMIETMHEAQGVGLAAVQVGRLRRLITVDLYDEMGPKVFVNPELYDMEGQILDYEACLSVTDTQAPVFRPEKLRLKAQDLNGAQIELEAEGLFARVLCHEVDHLNGILFTDKAEDESLMEEDK